MIFFVSFWPGSYRRVAHGVFRTSEQQTETHAVYNRAYYNQDSNLNSKRAFILLMTSLLWRMRMVTGCTTRIHTNCNQHNLRPKLCWGRFGIRGSRAGSSLVCTRYLALEDAGRGKERGLIGSPSDTDWATHPFWRRIRVSCRTVI